MSDPTPSDPHLDAAALDRYRRRLAPPGELLASDAHLATCDSCFDAVRAEIDTVELPSTHLTYEELEAFVDGRTDALDRELVAAHTTSCDLCRGELADLTAVRDGKGTRAPRSQHQVRPRT